MGKMEAQLILHTKERCTMYQAVFSGRMGATKFFITPAWI